MKELLGIALNLAIICFFAGSLLGLVNWGTTHAKERNQQKREQQISLSLLGYGPKKPAPPSMKIESIGRYLIEIDGQIFMGYTVPTPEGRKLVLLSVQGGSLGVVNAPGDIDDNTAPTSLCNALDKQVLSVKHVEDYKIAVMDGKVQGYLITGENLGFKTTIKMMVSLNSDFSVKGMAILEHEEDPGLGDEATQPYFKNQFVGKSPEALAKLRVVTIPMPEEYRKMMQSDADGNFTPEIMDEVKKSYGDSPVYAITGSTITSDAVTVGVKKAVARFLFRLRLLDEVLAQAALPTITRGGN